MILDEIQKIKDKKIINEKMFKNKDIDNFS